MESRHQMQACVITMIFFLKSDYAFTYDAVGFNIALPKEYSIKERNKERKIKQGNFISKLKIMKKEIKKERKKERS